jgi:hypothetical protein
MEALNRYLDAVHAEQQHYEDARARVLAALDELEASETTVPNLRRGIRAARRAREECDELAIRMAEIKPPDALKSAHESLVESLRLLSQIADELQLDLESLVEALEFGDTSKLPDQPASETRTLGARVVEARSKWRVAVAAYARDIGALVPPWVREVGKR